MCVPTNSSSLYCTILCSMLHRVGIRGGSMLVHVLYNVQVGGLTIFYRTLRRMRMVKSGIFCVI